jgi:hypothetical protein
MIRTLGFAIAVAGLYACADDGSDSLLRSAVTRHQAASSVDAGASTPKPAAKAADPSPSDAGAAAPAIAAFSNAPPFSLVTPSDESSDHHGGDSNAGKDCLSCHTGEGAPQFVIGGTVFGEKSGAEGLAGAEVRIVSKTGEELALVGTDSDGNFWLEGAAALPAGAVAGVRNATATKSMTGKVGTGSCNQSGCHASARPIVVTD